MSESYFTKLANEILDASEKLTNRFEEGLSILWGDLEGSGKDTDSDNAQQFNAENEFEGWEEEAMDDSSPLAGIAESVMGDIMASQVGLAGQRRRTRQTEGSPMTDERTT